ncbi:MAG: GNAT family acetyltransferase [Actinomycetota bacterium]
MPSVSVRRFVERDRERVIELWHLADLVRPWNDPHKDIDRKLSVADGMFLVATADGATVGTVMAGYDGHRGWINYLAVDPGCREAGVGRTLMEHAERALHDLGCPKVNLQIRTDNVAATEFYRRLGYQTDEVVSMGKRLVIDEPAE